MQGSGDRGPVYQWLVSTAMWQVLKNICLMNESGFPSLIFNFFIRDMIILLLVCSVIKKTNRTEGLCKEHQLQTKF